jgi:hypothetical protein
MGTQDRAMLGKKSPRTQMALRRVAAAAAVAANAAVPELLTTAERLALTDPENHKLVYDTSMALLMLWDGAVWQVT